MKKIPDVNYLKKNFKLSSIYLIILLIVLFIINIGLIYYLYYYKFNSVNIRFLLIPICMFILQFYNHYSPIFGKGIIIKDYPNNKIGKYKKEDILQLINDTLLTAKNRKEEIPNYYIVKSDSYFTSAGAVDIFIFNFIRSFNAIYIPDIYFYILTQIELRSVIAHELGHFRFYMNPIMRAIYIIFFFRSIVPAALVVYLWIDPFWYSYLVYFIIFFLLKFIIHYLTFLNDKYCEYLSDYYSAVKYGKLNMINALLATGRYIEFIIHMYKSVFKRLLENNKLALEDLNKIVEIIKESVPNILISKRALSIHIKEMFKSEKITSLERDLFNKDLVKKRSEIKKRLKVIAPWRNKMIDWKLFDFDKKDWKISRSEYPYLIKALIEHPKEQLLDIMYDNIRASADASHPTIRERILFLHKNIDKL